MKYKDKEVCGNCHYYKSTNPFDGYCILRPKNWPIFPGTNVDNSCIHWRGPGRISQLTFHAPEMYEFIESLADLPLDYFDDELREIISDFKTDAKSMVRKINIDKIKEIEQQ